MVALDPEPLFLRGPFPCCTACELSSRCKDSGFIKRMQEIRIAVKWNPDKNVTGLGKYDLCIITKIR